MNQPRRPRHLLDPSDLAGSHRRTQGSMRQLTDVQRWTMSALAVTTILHLSVGFAFAAVVLSDGRLGARIGLNVMAAVTGVAAVVAGRAIHGKPLLSLWLLAGVAVGVVGAWFTFA